MRSRISLSLFNSFRVWLLVLSSLASVASFSNAADTDPQPAPRLVQAYELGIATYTPAVAVLRLDQAIKNRKVPTATLENIALDTRRVELDSYHASVNLLKLMGAPDTVVKPYAKAVETLSLPLAITDDAKQAVPSDPGGQIVWSTLDEAEQVIPPDNGGLAAWLKLSRGRDSLWALHLGNIIAVIRNPLPSKPRDWPLIAGVGAVAQTTPAGTPSALTQALDDVADEAQHNKLNDRSLQALDSAASAVFKQPTPSGNH